VDVQIQRIENLLVTHASDHVGVEGGSVLALFQNSLTENLGTHLLNSLLAKERERLRAGVGGDTMALKTNLLHAENLGGRLESQMLLGVPCLFLGELCPINQRLRKLLRWPGSPLGGRADDVGRGRVGDKTRHFKFGELETWGRSLET
jgi:hypothetical protein